MITCRDAQHLFDRHLDGELPPSLQTELQAHRLNCPSCQSELAMAETFGDVIALDRCEPVMSASFTDRVLLAHRAQARPPRRQWSRMILLGGSPMAAAASILFALVVISPPKTDVAGVQVVNADPASLKHPTIVTEPKPTAAPAEMDAAPVAAGFVENLLAPLVESSRSTLEGTRRGAQELAYLLHMGLSDTNQMLVAQWESAQRLRSVPEVPVDAQFDTFDAFPPVFPDEQPARQDKPADSAATRVLQPL